MKKIFNSIFVIAIFLLSACNKDLQVKGPVFDVLTEQTNYKVGDTITFNFTGNVEYITFYSGEKGHDYKFKDRTTLKGVPQMEFTSYRQWGSQQNTLKLLISKDFNGVIDSNIVNYTWTDITSRATLSTGVDNTPSGIIDLTDFISDKPIYFAFQYLGYQEAGSQRTWTIKNFHVNTILDDGTVMPMLSSIGEAGWVSISLKNPDKKWTQNATQIQMAGGGGNTPNNEDWIVASLFLNKINPDAGIGIKDLSGSLKPFQFIPQEPGEHQIVFIGSNANIKGSKSVTRTLTIQVSP